MSHFASNGDGLVVTVDSESGDVLWIQNYGSPVVAFYIWQREGLWKVMHTNVGVETLRYLTFMSGEVGRITKWKYPFPKETEAKSKLVWVLSFVIKKMFLCLVNSVILLQGRSPYFKYSLMLPTRNVWFLNLLYLSSADCVFKRLRSLCWIGSQS